MRGLTLTNTPRRALPCVVLVHTTPHGRHLDWLIDVQVPQGPKQPEHRLWATRIEHPPAEWLAAGCLALQPLPAHRLTYLHFQGPIGQGRGRVARLAQGTAWLLRHTTTHTAWRLNLPGFSGTAAIDHADPMQPPHGGPASTALVRFQP